jgi:hypothetical protein
VRLARVEFLFACFLTLPVVAHTQIPGVKEDTPFRPSPGSNQWLEHVHNDGSSPVEALFSSFSCSDRGGLNGRVLDSRFNYAGDRSISPAGSSVVAADDPSDCSGGIKAAVFSDGHVEGSYEGLGQIFGQRKGAYEGLGVAIPLLNEVAEGQRTTPQLIYALQSLMNKLSRFHTPEAEGYRFIYFFLKVDWSTQSRALVVPSDGTASRGPDVDEVMKTQRVPLEQARAIVLSRKLKEWRSALEGHTEMPG